MITAFFFDLQHINSGGGRPEGYPKHEARKVAVLGAGMMGAAIAYVCAKAGLDVVLKDVSAEAAAQGKAYSEKLVTKAVARGKLTQDRADALLARITPTADAADLAGADLVIEAVFESPELKKKVFAEIEPHVAPDAVLGSNTSTLPITGVAEGVSRPEDFIGLHFFSPVDKMPLLEIVVGEKTSDATLAKALDIAQQIKKTPIVVNDSRGFFTSRVIGTFLNEAVSMVGEGVPPASIEQGRQPGRLPGAAVAADGRADPDAAAQDPRGDQGRRRGDRWHVGGERSRRSIRLMRLGGPGARRLRLSRESKADAPSNLPTQQRPRRPTRRSRDATPIGQAAHEAMLQGGRTVSRGRTAR